MNVVRTVWTFVSLVGGRALDVSPTSKMTGDHHRGMLWREYLVLCLSFNYLNYERGVLSLYAYMYVCIYDFSGSAGAT